MKKKETVLTGDRPTGPLHLGHYVGSLQQRVTLQNKYNQFVMIADLQALTDNVDNPKKVHDNVLQVLLDYLAVGIDPKKSTIFIQSLVPQIAELYLLYMNLVTVNRLKRNPTIKTEIKQRGFGENVSAGFLSYPVHQAADITIVKGTLIPVGEDQLPIIEQTNEIIRKFNRLYKTTLLPEAKPLVSSVSRLPGLDGKAKMSKSLGNAIFLSDPADVVVKKVMTMYTDPQHIHVEDPGKIEGNMVFTYLDAFDPDKDKVQSLKQQYAHGGLGDVKIKKYLAEVLNTMLEPIRQKRDVLAKNTQEIMDIALEGSSAVRTIAAETLSEVKAAIGIQYTNKK